MKTTCPKCSAEFEIQPQQSRAATSRWAGMTPEQRSAEMSRIRKKGVKAKEAKS
tara:strand:- start:8739 stop:8900 length:162 start_codon:yes stop_codon:yes gene_type:complete